MRRAALVCMAFLSVGTGGAASAASRASPTVVELYQSQGCSSCPPADLVLNQLADRPDVLALDFAVTYWDQLGWKDSFAQPAFTQRQWAYARAGSRGEVATPQMIVNGRGVLTGNRLSDAEAAIAQFDRGRSEIPISSDGRRVTIGGAVPSGTIVWLVAFDPRTIQVSIGAGENAGRTIPHRNIVRSLVALGKATGTGSSFGLPERSGQYRYAVLLQIGPGGAIIGARPLQMAGPAQ